MVLNPRHYDRWSGAHLVQGRKRLTSGISFRRSAEMRVSRGDFSGPYQSCVGHAMAGWRGACGRGAAGSRRASRRSRWRTGLHGACLCSALINLVLLNLVLPPFSFFGGGLPHRRRGSCRPHARRSPVDKVPASHLISSAPVDQVAKGARVAGQMEAGSLVDQLGPGRGPLVGKVGVAVVEHERDVGIASFVGDRAVDFDEAPGVVADGFDPLVVHEFGGERMDSRAFDGWVVVHGGAGAVEHLLAGGDEDRVAQDEMGDEPVDRCSGFVAERAVVEAPGNLEEVVVGDGERVGVHRGRAPWRRLWRVGPWDAVGPVWRARRTRGTAMAEGGTVRTRNSTAAATLAAAEKISTARSRPRTPARNPTPMTGMPVPR